MQTLIRSAPLAFLSTILLALAVAAPGASVAQEARMESLGGVGLLIEGSENVFTNPALAPIYSQRAFFSLGVTGGGGTVGLDPHGAGFVSIKEKVTLGIALNRSPQNYGFGRALWPVATAYLPAGPGGPLAGPEGGSETTAPLRFPLDFFLGVGNPYSRCRLGFNFYYAGGQLRDWTVSDQEEDGLEDSVRVDAQSHLFSGTIGVSGGTQADRVRPEAWVRVSVLSAWFDEQGTTETEPGTTEPTVDRIVALDRDLRVGGGARVHIGDAGQGLVLTPGFSYDVAFGSFRFDDNLIDPDDPSEAAEREASAHDARIGLGVAWRNQGLGVFGTASVTIRDFKVVDTVEDSGGVRNQTATEHLDLALPELSIGAEYELLPALSVRAGLRSAVVGGKRIGTLRSAGGSGEDGFYEHEVVQSVEPSDVQVSVAATGGLGLHVGLFHLDALLGGLFLGEAGNPTFFSRIDLGFRFN